MEVPRTFLFDLAERLGKTVAEMLSLMPVTELKHWCVKEHLKNQHAAAVHKFMTDKNAPVDAEQAHAMAHAQVYSAE